MTDNARSLRILCIDGDDSRQDAYRRAVAEIPEGTFRLLSAETAVAQARRTGSGFAVFAYGDVLADLSEKGASVA